jgi:hypothetical protein
LSVMRNLKQASIRYWTKKKGWWEETLPSQDILVVVVKM